MPRTGRGLKSRKVTSRYKCKATPGTAYDYMFYKCVLRVGAFSSAAMLTTSGRQEPTDRLLGKAKCA